MAEYDLSINWLSRDHEEIKNVDARGRFDSKVRRDSGYAAEKSFLMDESNLIGKISTNYLPAPSIEQCTISLRLRVTVLPDVASSITI